jgi:hypothetical protein
MDSRPDMVEAFKESAVRHSHDATLLEKAHRHANANQLIVLAAECAIKHAMYTVGGGFLEDGTLESRLREDYRIHINRLWDKLRPLSFEKRFRTLPQLLKTPNPFHDWSTDHRYATEGTVSAESSRRHWDMARRLLGSIGIIGTRAGS